MGFLRDFINDGNRPCKICKSPAPKRIEVRTFWKESAKNIALTNKFLSFRIYSKITEPVAFETFKLYLDSHVFEKETYNPANESLPFANNFSVEMICNGCESYSVQSSNFGVFTYSNMTSSISVVSENFKFDDEDNTFEVIHHVRVNKVELKCHNHSENKYFYIKLPECMTLSDFPIGSKSKMIKKVKTIQLLV